MKRTVHRYDMRTGVALCGHRSGSNRYTGNADHVTCTPCVDEGLARIQGQMQTDLERIQAADRQRAVEALRTAHGHLLSACIFAADTAHLLRMGGADALSIASARAIHQTLLCQVELQAALLAHLDPSEPAQDLEDVEKEATR